MLGPLTLGGQIIKMEATPPSTHAWLIEFKDFAIKGDIICVRRLTS